MRRGQTWRKKLTVYGLWEGYEADNSQFNRNVVPLSGVAGQEFSLLYPIEDAGNGRALYESSVPMTMFRQLEMPAKPLDPGTYYLDYWVEDTFRRRLPVGRAEVRWDGEAPTVPDGTWEGEVALKP